MANPVPFPTDDIYAATLIFNGPLGQGFSETYWMWIQATAPYVQAEKAMSSLIAIRKSQMPEKWVIQAMRVSDTRIRGDASLTEQPINNLGEGLRALPEANANNAWQMRLEDASFQVHEQRSFRAWPRDLIQRTSLADPSPPAEVLIWSQAMGNLLINGKDYSGAQVRFGIRSFLRPTLTNPVIAVNSVNVNAAGNIVIKVSASAMPPSWAPGLSLKVSVKRRRCVTGISGRHVIQTIDAGSQENSVTLQKKLCCGTDQLDGINGTAFLLIPAYYPIYSALLSRPGAKKTGRAFFVPRGRRSSVCC